MFILPKGLLGMWTFASLVIIGAEVGGAAYVKSRQTVETVTCKVMETVVRSEKVALRLECAGKEVFNNDPGVIISYLQKPSDLVCRVHFLRIQSCDEIK